MKHVLLNQSIKITSGFVKCLNNYRTLEDFEVRWQELVSYHGVQQKKVGN